MLPSNFVVSRLKAVLGVVLLPRRALSSVEGRHIWRPRAITNRPYKDRDRTMPRAERALAALVKGRGTARGGGGIFRTLSSLCRGRCPQRPASAPCAVV